MVMVVKLGEFEERLFSEDIFDDYSVMNKVM